MKPLWMLCCLTISLPLTPLEQRSNDECNNLSDKEPSAREHSKANRAHHCHNPACPHHKKDQDEKEKPDQRQLQQQAVTTLASMAQGILAIGWNPHNPTNIANNVTNIVGTFANFVAQAAKNTPLKNSQNSS